MTENKVPIDESKKNDEGETSLQCSEMTKILKIANIESTDLSSLTKLDIFNGGLSYLPESLADFLPNLKTMFLMKNNFKEVPAVVGSCKNLDMVSFKSNQLVSIHPEALQPQMRWLILTDNNLTSIPSTIGRCTKLQKFMLSGNKIESLPKEMESCANLELIRLASNQLKNPPMSLLSLPKLSWVALSDNPFLKNTSEKIMNQLNLGSLNLLTVDDEGGEILGKGASGITRKILLTNSDGSQEYVAVKKYAASITSDGNPFEERKATLAASSLKNDSLVPLKGQNENGSLVMELLVNYEALGNPPSMKTCSRDTSYDDDLKISSKEALALATKLLDVLSKLHGIGLSHGDFYAHNILVSTGDKCIVKLTDFGAAFFYDKNSDYGKFIERIEMRAYGHLVEELLMLMKRSGDSINIEKKLQTLLDICLSDTDDHGLTDLLDVM